MSKNRLQRNRPNGEAFFGLMVCAIFFAAGVVMGTFSARSLDLTETLALYTSISAYINQIADGTYVSPGFLSVLWLTGRYHLLALFLGFSLLGVLCLPVLAGVQGFYLSFSIAAFIRAFGAEGWPLAFSLFGIGALITIPCFFLLSTQAFATSAQLGRGVWEGKVQLRTLCHRGYIIRTAICFVGILAAVLIELHVTPVLVAWLNTFS